MNRRYPGTTSYILDLKSDSDGDYELIRPGGSTTTLNRENYKTSLQEAAYVMKIKSEIPQESNLIVRNSKFLRFLNKELIRLAGSPVSDVMRDNSINVLD